MDIRDKRFKGDSYSPEQVKRVLSGSGIDFVTELDSDLIVFCPYHGNYRTPAAEVNKESGIFFCFSCHHVASLIELVMHHSGRSYFEAARFIKSKSDGLSIEAEVAKRLVEKPVYTQYDEVQIKRLAATALESPRAVSYFNGRKITIDSMKRFSLGYSDKQDMVIVPQHSPDGILVGFVARSVEGKDFKNTPGLPKSKILFNLQRNRSSKRIYVVESSFDAIRLDQCGLPAVATLGSNVSNLQVELLKKYFNDIIVIADNDDAGGHMAARLTDRLGSRVSVIKLDDRYKDIGDMDDADIKQLEFNFAESISAILK